MPLLLRLALAAAAGAAVALSFEPHALVVLMPVGVAGLSLLLQGLRPRAGLLVGSVFGSAFMLVLLPWLQVIGTDAWIALAVLEGVEALRSSFPFGGFPWGRLAFATADTPAADLMAFVGPAGTTFAVALVGTALAWAVVVARRAPVRGIAAVVVPSVLVLSGQALTPGIPSTDAKPSRSVDVAAVQGDVPGEGMAAFAERRVVLENHVEATLELAEEIDAGRRTRPDLVVWPESSTDIDPFADSSVHADIQTAVDAVGVPVLVGAMVGGEDPRDVYNQGIVWLPGSGPSQVYSKNHPVPFGEYIPFRDVLAPYIQRLDQIPRDMVAGSEPGLFTVGETTVGDVICFEVAYDDLVRDVVRGGADLVVVQTNNATYMGTGQIEQQFAISRLRAIETNRYVVVAATNGVSGVIAPDGQVVERAPVKARAVLSSSLPIYGGETLAMRWGSAVEMLLTLGGAVSVSVALALHYRRRRVTAAGAAPDNPRETVVAGKVES
jgi:apolipoprotein N-acyltransferase